MPLARRSTLTAISLLALCLAFYYLAWQPGLPHLRSSRPRPPSTTAPYDHVDDFTRPSVGPASSAAAPLRALTPDEDPFRPGVPKPDGNYSRVLVVPRMKGEDVSWIDDVREELPDLQTAVYVMDDPWADFRVPKNKGRESMAYLTYVIDHYDDLPDVVLFFHAHKVGWHNLLILGQDSAEMLKMLRVERIWRTGYMPFRCDAKPGCPDWLHLDRPEVDFDEHLRMEEKYYTPQIWRELHPPGLGGMGEMHRVPGVLSAPCCAQFGVSRDRIRANPKEMYEHYRTWLLKTDLDDQYAGRIMEYTWHYIFTRQYQFCPSPHTCYCDGYGICFGSQIEYDKYAEKEERKWEIWDILNSRPGEAAEREAQVELRDLEAVMDSMKSEAIKRGKSEEARRLERERIPLH
ncbi:hypothetical protein BFW01_g6294 [Lasiodiplodia theobromae]|uniref:Uncharacterized protein n=1 Tax=Lasiodiplodia theobromae TaxID=45133 RepID=A0A5N5DN55_9PEZI|nr:uncharacterized protein LTHEOB_7845 [Lasiodiplodia theobromae]KAB2579366.1 hypothetical protein DBV05_g1917 [Lasiodiplodia theobromae]KAF4542163.1 hypothetical protein LTHEOB_7845 [Lasiodiplodia theobromae]KAF9635399.1 hypothetical protein BFW01_g6294 [Lasiodiplodia theobromae]